MKRFAVLLLISTLLLTACAAQSSPDESAAPVASYAPQGLEVKTMYTNLSEFISDLNEVQTSSGEINHESNRLVLYSLSEALLLFPESVPYAKGIESIEVGSDSIIVTYEPKVTSQIPYPKHPINIVWHRSMTPEILLNNFPIPDAISSKTIEDENGFVYFIEEFRLPLDDINTVFTVRWDYNGRAYSANVPNHYADADIFKLSDFENVLLMDVVE